MPSQVTFLGGPVDLQRHVLPADPRDIVGRSYFFPVFPGSVVATWSHESGEATLQVKKAEYVIERVRIGRQRDLADPVLVGVFVGER